LSLTARKLQYRTVTRHSIGALATLTAFFARKRMELPVISASKPTANVVEVRERPMMVRYCICQP
jgi:hypothetical protein